MATGGTSRQALVEARERERTAAQLFLRGLTWVEIGRQLAISDVGARKAFERFFRRLPKKDIQRMRDMEGERITDMRRRIWSELAGRQDAEGKTWRPEPDLVVDLIDRAIKVGRHEAMLFGLDAPIKTDVAAVFGAAQPITDEEAAARWARLTPEEQDTWMRLQAKMEGRWTEAPAIETTAVPQIGPPAGGETKA